MPVAAGHTPQALFTCQHSMLRTKDMALASSMILPTCLVRRGALELAPCCVHGVRPCRGHLRSEEKPAACPPAEHALTHRKRDTFRVISHGVLVFITIARVYVLIMVGKAGTAGAWRPDG